MSELSINDTEYQQIYDARVSEINKVKEWIEREERRTDMLFLRFIEKWPLRKIGEKYGLTRERVRQIIGNTSKQTGWFTKMQPLRNGDYFPGLTNQEVADRLGCSYTRVSQYRGKTRHAITPGCTAHHGSSQEEIVANILEGRGLSVRLMSFKHPFDLLVNDRARIDVKSRSNSCCYNKGQKTPTYSFHVRQGKRQDCDFYVCVLLNEEKYFVIPSSVISENIASIYISFTDYRNSKHRWHEYQDRFDLIEQFLAQP